MRKLYLDLVNRPKENLIALSKKLVQLRNGNIKLPAVENESILTLIDETEHSVKLSEMLGVNIGYEISTVSDNLGGIHSALVADHIANGLAPDVIMNKTKNSTLVEIPKRSVSIEYDSLGKIVNSNLDALKGQNAMLYMASNMEQDMGLVIMQDGRPVYLADISRFEKTPKDLITGKDTYVGRDMLEFHGKAKTYGHILPNLMSDMVRCMSKGKLDLLTVDLLGANTYRIDSSLILGEPNLVDVRRFERDYAVPLKKNDVLEGVAVYTDVWFQPIGEKSPLEGGRIVNVGTDIHKYRLKD